MAAPVPVIVQTQTMNAKYEFMQTETIPCVSALCLPNVTTHHQVNDHLVDSRVSVHGMRRYLVEACQVEEQELYM